MKKKLFQFYNHVIELIINEDKAAEPVCVMIYDAIGKDPWSGQGISAKDIRMVLSEAPKDRDLHVRVNSKGGDVHEGTSIRNAFDEWPKNVAVTIDGVAASTASWIAPKRATVRAFKNSQIFIHDAISFGFGNAEDFRKAADNLDKTSDQIAGMYAEKCGKGVRTMRGMMQDETLLTGEEAESLGLVDELIDGTAVRNFAPEELVSMKNQLKALYNSVSKNGDGQPQTNIMNKKKLIAILNKHGVTQINGVTVTEETPIEHLEASLEQVLENKQKEADKAPRNQDFEGIRNEIKELKEANKKLAELNDASKKLRITGEVDQLIANDQLPAGLKDKAIARAMKDEEYLNELKALPSRPPGAAPLSASKVQLLSDSFADVQNYMLENGPRFMSKFVNHEFRGIQISDTSEAKVRREIRDRAIIVANTYQKHRKMLTEMFNANVIDAALQRTVILQETLEEFAIILLALTDFSTVFSNVPLEGTDKVAVPYYPLQGNASSSWDPAAGYNAMAATATQMRDVEVGGSGVNSGANAAANTAKDRKWIGMEFTSYELARQPYLNWSQLGKLNGNKLAVDIFNDIISRVITAANYGGAMAAIAPAAMTGDNIADMWETATGLNWPSNGRSLTLDHTYLTPLLKDPTFKQYLAAGNTEALRNARISNAYQFENINVVPNLSNYSPANEKLRGWIAWRFAMLVATAPIMPTPEVRALLTRYDLVVHPTLGLALEYRRGGNTLLDKTQETIECSYGAKVGVNTALRRIAAP